MECPICMFNFDSSEHRPLKTFCVCGQTLCLSCVNLISLTKSFCPWDRTRWNSRKLLSNFEKSTPKNYLQLLIEKGMSLYIYIYLFLLILNINYLYRKL